MTLIPPERESIQYLGPLGVNGLTAYFGLFRVGRPARGDRDGLAAAGSVGHFVGQMAKIQGVALWEFAEIT